MICEHGKTVADAGDMRDFANRPECWNTLMERNVCDCWECSRVCWATACVMANIGPNREPEPWEGA